MSTTTTTAPETTEIEAPAETYKGQSVPRKEDRRLVQGQGVFVDDVKRHGMGYIHFVRSPYAHAHITSLDVSKADNADELRAVAALLKEKFGAAIEAWPTERVRAVLKSDDYFQALHYPGAFHIDPLNYAHGLANAALAAGAAIFEESPALAIDPAGVRKRITTPSGRKAPSLRPFGQVIEKHERSCIY